MSQVEYLFAQNLIHNPDAINSPEHADFYRRHGLDQAAIDSAMGRGYSYVKLTSGLPGSYHRLAAGDRVSIGGRALEVLTGGGHSQEQVMLLDREGGLFFAADQVLARISPNIGVWPWEPLADPLGDYLQSLSKLRAVPDDVLVLPAHNLPFYGLHQRLADLERHHELRCAEIADACGGYPRTIAESFRFSFRAHSTRTRPVSRSARCWRTSTSWCAAANSRSRRTRKECCACGACKAARAPHYPNDATICRYACSGNAFIEIVRTLPVLPSISVKRAATASSGAS